MPDFKLVSDFKPTGDQPRAISEMVASFNKGNRFQTLLGVTGSGKTFTAANIVEHLQRPTLVIAHNKTLAAQLATEFKEFFPHNAVEYFVSYYDYYQPEAYVPQTDTYIEKDASINEEIDKLRHSATRSLLTRRDVLIVASVSCIYGLGDPEEYYSFVAPVKVGEHRGRSSLVRDLVAMQYERNDMTISRGKFRMRGDTLEMLPSYEEIAVRIQFWGDEVERIVEIDPLTGEILADKQELEIYPAKHFVTSEEKLRLAVQDIKAELEHWLTHLKSQGKILEAARLESRTHYDLEMMTQVGYCSGIENYSRHIGRRTAGSTPWTLLDYFPPDFLMFIDEAHMTIPQLRGMYHGDISRKQTLVDFGFRLPSALDNRPLSFREVEDHFNQVGFISATPGPYEMEVSQQVVEQIIRPTGLLDPTIEVKPTKGQIDDLVEQIQARIDRKERCLVTTLTKRMAEELSDYLQEMGIRVHYLHSEIHTLERIEILRDLRLGIYDVVVGINLLREGLDLPEVSLVAILDADKEGYLRSSSALIQTVGRTARHVDGHVIMYADVITRSMRTTLDETDRRRKTQQAHNESRGIIPKGIQKSVKDITDRVKAASEEREVYSSETKLMSDKDLFQVAKDLEGQMKLAAKNLEFEKAAMFRDEVVEIRRLLALSRDTTIK
ncbi:excinuclease ABC subunit UvrB [SAR202 cluster bacterium AD-804-J14_MRT_500m]|nr:excinuclease ABC subunit UvrB [SAR202 cluster bacterium AD-804-J14_MRT_500m]